MGFREHLQDICEGVEGAVACSVMGFDGISIDTHEASVGDLDVSSLLVEYTTLLNQVRSAAGVLQSGGVKELVVATDRLTTLARPLNDEYYLLLALTPEGNWGKARYLMRVTAPKVQAEF
jgi:predicted regulator of Ras-like GTPase activity (Roadblock/LC7/MglB family)